MVNQVDRLESPVDVAIVGGGPAGLATAINLRRKGFEVALFDLQEPPIDKPCGEGLMPSGVQELKRLGIQVRDSWAFPVQGIRYRDGDKSVEGVFPRGQGRGIRRPNLHQRLTTIAEQHETNLYWGVQVQGIRNNQLQTDRGMIEADWIVGADGLYSRVRDWSGLELDQERTERFARVRHYAVEPWTDFVEVYWDGEYEIYVTPLPDKKVAIALLTEHRSLAFDRAIQQIKPLNKRLRTADTSARDQGWGPLYQTTEAVRSDHVLLVGDAAGYRDAITGEGLSLAFKQARVLAESLNSGSPDAYENSYHSIVALPFTMIEFLLWLRQYPALRRGLMSVLGNTSSIFSWLLSINDRGLRSTLLDLSPTAWD